MKANFFCHLFCAGLIFLSPTSAHSSEYIPATDRPEMAADGDLNRARAMSAAASGRSGFEENKGQVYDTDGNEAQYVDFVLNRGNLSLYLLHGGGMAWQFKHALPADDGDELHTNPMLEKLIGPGHDADRMPRRALRYESYRMDVVLEDANPAPVVRTEGRSTDYTNYYHRNALEVFHYEKVIYEGVYPGIDWVIYTHEAGVKYDFIVHPGADPALIQMRFSDHETLYLDTAGNLVQGNRLGEIVEKAPLSYQHGRVVESRFVLEGDVLGFEIGDYNTEEVLTIDPERIWSTYYGAFAMDQGFACTADGLGNVYLAGTTASTNNIAFSGFQNFLAGDGNAFLVKFNSSGLRLWATYYGGQGFTFGLACAVDDANNVYLAGDTESSSGIASGGQQNVYGGGTDGFLVKFNSGGGRLWATYYGGSDADFASACATDADGNVYLTGSTGSLTGIASGGHQNEHGGYFDAFLVKFHSDGERLWGTYFGGPGNDSGSGCVLDQNGNVFISGSTTSEYGMATSVHQAMYGGGSRDAFLAKFSTTGNRIWASYYGGGDADFGTSCAIDPTGNAYLAGRTRSSNNMASQGHQGSIAGGQDGFLVKFSPSGARMWGTYYGGNGDDWVSDCAADGLGNIYISGRTSSTNGIAFEGFQNSYGGGDFDAFLVKFNPSGDRLWGSYFGGSHDDAGWACATDVIGRVYLAGTTRSTSGIASNGHQLSMTGLDDAFLAMIQDDDFGINTFDVEKDTQLYAFPNPGNSEFTLKVPEGSVGDVFRLYDISGKVLISGNVTSRLTTIEIGGLARGIYLLSLDGLPGKGIRVVCE